MISRQYSNAANFKEDGETHSNSVFELKLNPNESFDFFYVSLVLRF